MTIAHSTTKLAVGAGRCIKRAFSQVGELGSGAGKGGGEGGPIRTAGGAFGKKQAGREEEYFKALEREQLKTLQLRYGNLRREMEREIEEHESQAREHKEAAERLRRRIRELQSEEEQLQKH